MTTNEVIDDMKRKLSQMDKAFGLAVHSTHAQYMQRIFVEGRRASGGRIGQYNAVNPLYVNPKNAPRKFTPLGKGSTRATAKGLLTTGRKSKFKNGNPHKTRWFNSYRDYRQFEGRESGFVNLVLFGQLRSDLANGIRRVEPGRYVVGVKNPKNANKLAGAIDKYGEDVFYVSKEERQTLDTVFQEEAAKILR